MNPDEITEQDILEAYLNKDEYKCVNGECAAGRPYFRNLGALGAKRCPYCLHLTRKVTQDEVKDWIRQQQQHIIVPDGWLHADT